MEARTLRLPFADSLKAAGTQVRLALMVLFVSLSLGLVSALFLQLWNSVINLRTASTSNVQWRVGQLEIESLKLQLAAERAITDPLGDLDEVRARFDLFYSRVHLARSGYAAVLLDPKDILPKLAELESFVNETEAIINGPDEALRADLPALRDDVAQMSVVSRDIAIWSVKELADLGGRYHALAENRMKLLAVIETVVIVVFLVTIAVMVTLYQTSLRRGEGLNAALSRLQTTLNATLDSVVVVDRKGRIVGVSGAFESMFGHTGAEVIGTTIWDRLAHDSKRNLEWQSLLDWLINPFQGVIRFEASAKRKTGEKFPAEVSVANTRIDGEAHFTLFIRDETDVVEGRRKLVDALEKTRAAEQAKSHFIAVMNHEMRTPLNGIVGGVELMKKTDLDDRQGGYIRMLDASAKHLLSQVNRVLDISRIESGKIEVHPVWFNPASLLDPQVSIISPLADLRDNKVVIETRFQPGIEVFSDADILRHVVMNLLANANKFTKNGTIRLTGFLNPNNDMLTISIQDTGIGIKPENLELIFEDFFSANGEKGQYQEGAGLGLGIARRLTQALAGTLSVDSVAGKGSVFIVAVPSKTRTVSGKGEADATAIEAVPPPGCPPLDILFCEDDPINREVISAYLRDLGHTPFLAEKGNDCIDLLETRSFDLVLMDFFMPEMDGFETVRRIRENYPGFDTPVIGFSADNSPETMEKAREVGLDMVISKPITPGDLSARLAEACAGRITAMPLPAKAGHAVPPSVDRDVLYDLSKRINVQRVAVLVRQFSEEVSFLPQLNEYMALSQTAHRLAGAGGFLGAAHLRAICSDIETAAREGDTDRLPGLLDQLATANAAFVRDTGQLDTSEKVVRDNSA